MAKCQIKSKFCLSFHWINVRHFVSKIFYWNIELKLFSLLFYLKYFWNILICDYRQNNYQIQSIVSIKIFFFFSMFFSHILTMYVDVNKKKIKSMFVSVSLSSSLSIKSNIKDRNQQPSCNWIFVHRFLSKSLDLWIE